jgi:hypothetical protein
MTNQLATNVEEAESQTAETSEQEQEEKEQVPEVQEEEEKKEPEKIRQQSRTVPIERFNEVYGNMRRLERLATQLLDEKKAERAKPKENEVEPDYDSMTPKELVTYIRKVQKQDLREALDETLTPMKEQTQLRAAQESIEYAANKYKDFFSYKPEMIELADRYPNLDAESLYLIASGKKGAAGEHIMQRLKDKVTQKKNALTEHRSSAASRQTTQKEFKSVREGALAAAKELGYDV